MKKWIDINKELPPLEQPIRIKYKNQISCGKLYKDNMNRLVWKISHTLDFTLYYEIRYHDKMVHFWEKEIFIPINNRWEILDL